MLYPLNGIMLNKEGFSMNSEKNKTDTNHSTSKIKPFYKYFFMMLILLALSGGIYYVIFTTDYFNNQPVQTNTQEKRSQVETDREERATDTTSMTGSVLTPESMSTTDSISTPESLSVTGSLLTADPNQITPLSNNTNPQTTTPLSGKQERSNNLDVTENSLPISDMRQGQKQTTDITDVNNTNSTNATNNISNTNTTQKNDFILTPPQQIKTTGFVIPSEKELEVKRNKTELNKLEMLQEAKSRQIQLAENEKAALPGASMQISLSNKPISFSPQDPVITNIFIEELANLLVSNYHLKQKNTQLPSALNSTKLSQHFGLGMTGLIHPNGRYGVFKYAYQANMIQTLSRFIAPQLITEIDAVATAKKLTKAQKQDMYHYYAKHIKNTAIMLEAVVNTQELQKDIDHYLEIERELVAKKKKFADTLIEFEIAKQENAKTTKLEVKLNQISHGANAIENALLSSRSIITSNVAKNAPSFSKNPELFDLALWVNRRKNINATNAAIQALHSFSSLLSQK